MVLKKKKKKRSKGVSREPRRKGASCSQMAMPFPAPCRAGWECLGLWTHPIYPALEYVCCLWRKCTRPEALNVQTMLVVLFLCFPKGRVSPSPGGGRGLPPWAAVLARCLCFLKGHWGTDKTTGSLAGATSIFTS